MDRDLPFGYTHRQKRSHAQMELEGSSSPTWSALSHLPTSREPSASASYSNHADLHLPQLNNMPSATPRRYPGDGLDYRRPVTSSNVIDLTVEDAGPSAAPSSGQRAHARLPRPPRFGREIMRDVIDLDAEDTRGAAPAPTSPEIEIISSRRLDPPRPANPPAFGGHIADEDDVEFLSENRVPRLPEALRGDQNNLNVSVMQALLSDMNVTLPVPRLQEQFRRRAERQRQATMNRFLAHTHRHPVVPPRASRGRIRMDFLQPNINYGEVAFDMGLGTADPDEERAVRPPTYEAPGKAPLGFTRSPQEEDTLMCPNCGDELCVGESDLKKQVWIAKHCGHVYCGECTVNRSIKKSAKGKEKQAAPRTKPFKECVVEGCEKKVSNKSHMFQVFL